MSTRTGFSWHVSRTPAPGWPILQSISIRGPRAPSSVIAIAKSKCGHPRQIDMLGSIKQKAPACGQGLLKFAPISQIPHRNRRHAPRRICLSTAIVDKQKARAGLPASFGRSFDYGEFIAVFFRVCKLAFPYRRPQFPRRRRIRRPDPVLSHRLRRSWLRLVRV